MEKIRIQKFFTDNAVMSRRAAEEAIRCGRICVNGEKAILGMKVDPQNDRVTLDGKEIVPVIHKKTYIMLNKPSGYVTTVSDERGRPTVCSLVRDCGTRVYPVGRLDMNSEGLLLLTNDGDFTLRLTHPKHEIPKIYHVTATGALGKTDVENLKSIRRIDGYTLAEVGIKIISENNNSTCLEFVLHEGRNRQIRKMCQAASVKISKLERVAIGKLKLGTLPYGKWRYLTDSEVNYLYGKEKEND